MPGDGSRRTLAQARHDQGRFRTRHLPLTTIRLDPATGQRQVHALPGDDGFAWTPARVGERLALACRDGSRLEPGWYQVEGTLEPKGNCSLLPALHLGRSGDQEQVGLLPLVEGARSRSRRVVTVSLPRASDVLYLDPGPGTHRGIGVTLTLARVTRGHAIRSMLSGLGHGEGGARARLDAWMELLWRGLTGPRRVGPALVSLYQRSLLRDMPRRPSLPLRVRTSTWPIPAMRMAMHAADQLQPDTAAAHGRWISTGTDPKFILPAQELGRTLPAGWYRLRASFGRDNDVIVTPCLYPSYAAGGEDGALIALDEPDAGGRLDCLVMLPRAASALRFDPTTRRAAFTLDGVSLHRVSRPGALLRMLVGLARSNARPTRTVIRACGDFARELAASGASHAAGSLFRRYRNEVAQGASGYDNWIRRYDDFSALDLAAMRERAAALAAGPKVSILVPVYETPERWLRRCIDSVLGQAYGNWELCLANDASPSAHVRRVLDDYAARDRRIRVVHREVNGHISEASNSALAIATGDFIALLDHDDELRPHALLEVVQALQARPELGLVYSDEDKIDEAGRRFDPYFKPDWNPDLLRGQNYVCHFTVIRSALVREVGGFRKGLEGSQDHDLILRCSERLQPGGIHHIPKVLYHWRAIAGSTALHRDAKDYASIAGARAVGEHLARTAPGARVEELPHGHYRVRWPLPATPPCVSLVVPTRDRADLLRTCVESILGHSTYPDLELVVVDNQSSEPDALEYLASLESRERVRVLRYDAPFNYSAINNWAVAQCRGAVIGLVNNDIEVITPDWLGEMVSQALRPEVGAVGAMLYYPDDTIQHAGVVLGVGGIANHAYVGQPRGYPGHGGRARVAQEFSAVTAACLLVRREVYEQVGGLDERLQVAFNDIDFCLRLREAGYLNVWTPFAELYHHESASRGSDDAPEKRRRFLGEVDLMESRWGHVLHRDPAYNPNLALDAMDFRLAFPPRGD